MAKQVIGMCKYGSETAITRLCDTMVFSDLKEFICGKWCMISDESPTLSYQMPGHSVCMLQDEDDFRNMLDVVKVMNMDHLVIGVIYVNAIVDDQSSGLCYGDSLMTESTSRSIVDDFSCNIGHKRQKLLLGSDWAFEICGVDQEFKGGAEEFRKSLCKYAIQMGFQFKYLKNDRDRVTAVYIFREDRGCLWRVHASKQSVNNFFYIKRMNNEHTCGSVLRTSKHPRVTSDLVASLYFDKIREKPLIRPKDIIRDIKTDYGIDIMYHLAWFGVEYARGQIYGDHALSFDKLRWYFKEAEKFNPGSRFVIDTHPESHRFVRCFVAFEACLHGFNFIRPMIFLDGTFLKGRYKGAILGATCKDGNGGIFSLAFSVVNCEDRSNWIWFLTELKKVLNPERKLTFISDRHIGLIEGIRSVFPDHFHAYCLHHMKMNLRDKFRSVRGKFRNRIVYKFDSCANASTTIEFEREMDSLLSEGGQKVRDFLSNIPKEHWCNAFFEGQRYGEMFSNVAESWNAKIVEARHLPITDMIDRIRLDTMETMSQKRNICKKWTGFLCPTMHKKLQLALDEGRSWSVSVSSDDIYEVNCHPHVFVDLKLRSCSCGKWQQEGFPCAHAATVIHNSGKITGHTLTDYIEPYFYVRYFEESYSKFIHPFSPPAHSDDGNSSDGFIFPPVEKKQPGRPRKKRIPSRGEIIRQIRCSRCKKMGSHNRKSCREIIK